MNEHLKNIIFIALGAFLAAVGINAFVIPTNLGEGGSIGISLILKYTLSISPALSTLIINIFLIIIGWKYLSRVSAIYTIFTITFISLFLTLTERINLGIDSTFIAVIFGGVLIGIGTGLILNTGGTLGGTSVIAMIIYKYFNVKPAKGLLILDIVVVVSALVAISFQNVLFTIVMLFMVEKAMSFVLEGFNPQKAVTIISHQHKAISESIYQATGRGATLLNGKGQYSQKDMEVIYVVISQNQLTPLKQIINDIDQDAFFVVHDVRDVFGNGFLRCNN